MKWQFGQWAMLDLGNLPGHRPQKARASAHSGYRLSLHLRAIGVLNNSSTVVRDLRVVAG